VPHPLELCPTSAHGTTSVNACATWYRMWSDTCRTTARGGTSDPRCMMPLRSRPPWSK
jgi:hypothetical protein